MCEKYSAYFILYQTIHGKGDIQFAANLSNFAVWRTILKTVSVLSPSFYVSLRQFASVCVALLSCDGNAGFIDKNCFRNVTSLCVVLRRFTSNVQTETVRAYFRGTVSVMRAVFDISQMLLQADTLVLIYILSPMLFTHAPHVFPRGFAAAVIHLCGTMARLCHDVEHPSAELQISINVFACCPEPFRSHIRYEGHS